MNFANTKRFGPFEIHEKLGQGGMASVYRARYAYPESQPQASLERLQENEIVALKIANELVVNEPILAQRLFNEYEVTHRLRHPNLVRALGYGVEDALPYLVLEYLSGGSLDKNLKTMGPLPLDRALRIFEEVIAATTFIHRNRLIHRDIKPGNILIDYSGRAKLADLGLMKDQESEAMLTQPRGGLGTLAFAAPEQFDDAKNVDPRSDVFGLAATFYFALTGKFPYGCDSAVQVMKRKLDHQLIPLSAVLPGMNCAVDHVIIRALHPDPCIRPGSAEELLAGLRGRCSPAFVPLPRAPERSPPNAQGRRTHMRFPMRLPTMLGTSASSHPFSAQAIILDVSTGGLRLECPRKFDLNTRLRVDLPSEYIGLQASFLVQMRWRKKLPHNDWMIGCTFIEQLAEEDLDRFLILNLAHTDGGLPVPVTMTHNREPQTSMLMD